MSHYDCGWRPDTVESYDGFEVYDHGVWAVDLHDGEVDGDLSVSE